jgi:hypothetical protein
MRMRVWPNSESRFLFFLFYQGVSIYIHMMYVYYIYIYMLHNRSEMRIRVWPKQRVALSLYLLYAHMHTPIYIYIYIYIYCVHVGVILCIYAHILNSPTPKRSVCRHALACHLYSTIRRQLSSKIVQFTYMYPNVLIRIPGCTCLPTYRFTGDASSKDPWPIVQAGEEGGESQTSGSQHHQPI